MRNILLNKRLKPLLTIILALFANGFPTHIWAAESTLSSTYINLDTACTKQQDEHPYAEASSISLSLNQLDKDTQAIQTTHTTHSVDIKYFKGDRINTNSLRLFCSPALSSMDEKRRNFGRRINYASDSIDAFFMDWFFGEKTAPSQQRSHSRGRFFIQTRTLANGQTTIKPGLDIRIDLPNTEKRSKLIFSTTQKKSNREPTQNSKQTDDVASAGLQLVLGSYKQLNPKAILGSRWVNGVPEAFFESSIHHDFGSPQHKLTPEYTIAWYKNTDWTNRYSLKYYKQLNDHTGLSTLSNIEDRFKKTHWTYYHDISLQQRLSSRNAMVYTFSIYGDNITAPDIDYHTTSIRWRRRIHSTWLYIGLEPRYTHSVTSNINPHQMAYYFNIDALFNE